MVRIIVGALVRVGEGKIKPNEIKNIILSKATIKGWKIRSTRWIMLGRSFLLK